MSAVSRARRSGLHHERDDLDPRGDLGQRGGLLAAGGVERHGQVALEAALVVVGRLPVAGQVDGHVRAVRDYCALSPPTKTATWARSASARALASIGLTWEVGTPRIFATSSAAARALAS